MGASMKCLINVTFTPAATRLRSASLTITDDAGGSPHTVSVAGTGAAVPIVTLSPQSLTFGHVNENSATAPQTVILSYTGNALLSIPSITFSGPRS